MQKFFDVLIANLGITAVMLIAICLFGIFSDGLLGGLITALSAVIAFSCGYILYKEFKKKK